MERTAKLARLRLTERERDRFARDLNRILALVDSLDDLPGEAIHGPAADPSPHAPPDPNPDPLHRSIAEFAPSSEESFFLVPKLPAHRAPPHPDEGTDGEADVDDDANGHQEGKRDP